MKLYIIQILIILYHKATGLSRVRRTTNETKKNTSNAHNSADTDYEEDERDDSEPEQKYQDYGNSCLSTDECTWPLICEEVEHVDGTKSNICNCDEK